MTSHPNEPSITPRCARLLSALTHELRTPLGSVLMLAEMLSSEDGGHQAVRARKVHQAAEDMRTLLDQVARLARVESGRTPCDVEALATSSLRELFEQDMRGRSVTPPPTIRAADPLPQTVHADPKLLVDIVGLLVADIASERAQAVQIAIRSKASYKPTRPVVVIEVHHPSIVVPPEQLVDLFEPFHTSVQNIGRRHGGRTLSLTIAQSLSHRMNAALGARSDHEGSLVFDLALPATD